MSIYTAHLVIALSLVGFLACASPAKDSDGDVPRAPAGAAMVPIEDAGEPTYADWVAFAERIKEVGRIVDDQLVPELSLIHI